MIWYSVKRKDTTDVDFRHVPAWEAFLWFVCTLLNLTVLMLSWVGGQPPGGHGAAGAGRGVVGGWQRWGSV